MGFGKDEVDLELKVSHLDSIVHSLDFEDTSNQHSSDLSFSLCLYQRRAFLVFTLTAKVLIMTLVCFFKKTEFCMSRL